MQWSRMAESYSDPFSGCEKALRAGMTFFTLTDHNSIDGCLMLRERYGELIINGVESTVSFPEDDCLIHLLIYGMTEKQFSEIQLLRKDIYQLRDFIKEQDLAHSVAHATYGIQGKSLTPVHLEKLIVLFNTFEIMNGARNRSDNMAWQAILESLTPESIYDLQRKHGLKPFDDTPWEKGFTGGSDDHAGIFTGRTYTLARAESPERFLQAIKNKETKAGGRHGDYQSLVYSIFKIIYDFSRTRSKVVSRTLIGELMEKVFEEKPVGLINRLRIKRLRRRAKKTQSEIYRSFLDLAGGIEKQKFLAPDDAIQFIDSRVTRISDAFLSRFLVSLGDGVDVLSLFRHAKNMGGSFSGILLALPFFLTLKHMHENRAVVERLVSNLGMEDFKEGRKILWFTDTINDLNGVSETLREIGWLCSGIGFDLKIVTSLPRDADTGNLPSNVINLGCIHSFRLPYYNHFAFNIPSILGSLKEIYNFDPDRIYISTPGPLGLIGLLASRLMHVRTVGFYHTDFTLQAREIEQDRSVPELLESYTKWFYSKTDEIKVPTNTYLSILKSRGFPSEKLSVFKRGIADVFLPDNQAHDGSSHNKLSTKNGFTFLYAGRISRDKGLDFLFDVYERITDLRPDTKLLIVGDGPYLCELKMRPVRSGNVYFTGRVDHARLAEIYRKSHVFLFPSTTDTFGRVVLEAQACGLPVVVSDAGGPCELVLDGKTGFVAKAGDIESWEGKIVEILHMTEHLPHLYERMRESARKHVAENFCWERALNTIFGDVYSNETAVEKKIA